MKKTLLVLTVLAAVIGLTSSAWADCVTCKDPAAYINIPTGVTIGQQATTCTTGCFDYDGVPEEMPAAGRWARYGYCTGYNNISDYMGAPDPQTRTDLNPKLIFRICECGSEQIANNLNQGQDVGVRMTIETQGVYWCAPNVTDDTPGIGGNALNPDETRIDLATFNSEPAACAATQYQSQFDGLFKTFGRVQYYMGASCVTEGTPYGGNNCTVPNNQKVKAIQSFATDGYVISAADITNKVSDWWIDIPPLRVDASEVVAGQTVMIKVGLIGDRQGTICAACLPFCTCDFPVGILGCPAAALSATMYFPYVVTQTGNWSTGIAVANFSEGVSSPVATMRLTDSTGTVYTANVPMTKTVDAWVLDSIIPGGDAALTWSPTGTPAPGAAWLCVTGNFSMDGYSFLTDGTFGCGTLARININACP